MARDSGQYRDQLKALLPPGRAISGDAGATIDDLLLAMAEEWARLDARALALLVDVNPTTALEVLPDWERVAGLLDTCGGSQSQTLQGRRADLVGRLAATGGQSRAYFIAVAAAIGYAITITEFRPFRVGFSAAGDGLSNGDWAFTWRVNAPDTTRSAFRVGISAVGEALSVWGNERLECIIGELKPAHTILQFQYS